MKLQSIIHLFCKRNANTNYPINNTAISADTKMLPRYEIAFPCREFPFVPYYRKEGTEDDWTRCPSRGSFYYDPIEDSREFKKVIKHVDALVNQEMGDTYRLGDCHRAWGMKRQILKEYYGIEWHSGAELNPNCMFD